MSPETRRALESAFREITWGLMGLFEMHDLEPRVAADAGEMMDRIYQAHAHGKQRVPPTDGMKRLLKQLDHDQAAQPGRVADRRDMDTSGTGTDTIDPNEPVDLTHLDGSFGTAEATTNGAAPPDGKYQVNVDKAEIVRSKTNSQPMLKWTLKIMAPSHVGRVMWRYNMLATPENMKWLKGDLQTCGLMLDKVSNLQSRLAELLDVKLEVNKRTRGEHENIYFIKRLVLDDVADAPGFAHGGQAAGGFNEDLPF